MRSAGVQHLAGKLCRNALLDGGQRLDDVAGGQFVIVTMTTPTPREHADIARRGCSGHHRALGQ